MPDAARGLRGLVAVAAAGLAALVPAVPAAAQDADERVDLGAYGAPLRFEAPPGTTIEVEGVGRFADTVEFRLASDGDLVVVNELGIEQYVEGIAEMPARWPEEALKAQAVAARTYAWWQARQGTFERRGRGYDICATTACQVFDGRAVVELPELGERWAAAVAETAGEVLLYDGAPILARYFSTSGGSTRDNEDVFPSEGPRPYLEGVDDPQDVVSPLHTWEVRFDRDLFDDILSRGQTLSAAVPMANIELVPAVAGSTDRIRVVGADGTVAEVSASQFRAFVSARARALDPDRYPSERSDGSGRLLPDVLPSSRISFMVTDDEVVVAGRGWGHGVGMSQWGAMGRAEEGATYDEILHAYYTGVDGPTAAPALPDRIRVGLDALEGTGGFRLSADGPVRLLAGGTELTPRALGTWEVVRRADRSMGLAAPAGYGAPLVLSPAEPSRTEPYTVEVVTVETVLNKPAELFLDVVDAAGSPVVSRRPLGIGEAGRQRASWDLDDDRGVNVAGGRYTASVVAVDEDGVEVEVSADLEVREVLAAEASPSLLAPPDAGAPTDPLPLRAAVLLGALGLGGLLGSAVPVRPHG